MSVKIRKHIVSKAVVNKVTYGGRNPIRYIVIHETANTSKGANANAHARLQANGNSRQASWHYTVDDKEAVQSFDDRAQCWHAGNRKYNEQSIGIEICVNSDGNYRKAVDNAAALARYLMQKYNVSISRVVQHNHASGKDCPRYLRSGAKGVNWVDFKRLLGEKANAKPAPKKPSNNAKKTHNKQKTIAQMAQEVIDGKHGNGHSQRQKSLGVSSSVYAKVRSEVNARLLGKTTKNTSKKVVKSVSQMADEVIRGKHGQGHANRRRSLGVDKETYEKVRREVNRRLK